MNFPILHGLEYELQLMAETEDGLEVVDAMKFLKHRFELLPSNCTFDLGNIEIQTSPKSTYKEAVEEANNILINQLVPSLIKKFKLTKFALFLPTPLSRIYIEEIHLRSHGDGRFLGHSEFQSIPLGISCLKHWNISFPFHTVKIDSTVKSICFNKTEEYCKYDEIAKKNISKWKYNYEGLKNKGYSVSLKDVEDNLTSRIHIKIPYHYSPPEGNPDLMPKFEDTIIPPDKWKNLICYYKNHNFVMIRNLI